MSNQVFRERECVHRGEGGEGTFYNGTTYVQHLQRLSSEMAVQFAGRVSPFFWADAPNIVVWLCRKCAADLRLADAPGTLTAMPSRRSVNG